MYKILVTAGVVDCRWQSPTRKVESQSEDPKVELVQEEKEKVRVSRVEGRVHLFKTRREGKESSSDVNFNLQANQIDVKTQVVFLSQISDYLPTIMSHIEQRSQHIELVQLIDRRSATNSTITSLLVYFRNILISEEFYAICGELYHKLPIYIKEVEVYETLEREESTEVLNYANDHNSLTDVKEEQSEASRILTQRWIELPQCTQCLQKLEYDITGLPPSVFPVLSSPPASCKTCTILSQKATNSLQTHCEDCSSPQDNWICMVCNRVGCGRYKNADAFKHFRKTGHFLTMDLQTQRVWNYLSDCFSHRVIALQKQEITLKFPDYSQQDARRNEESLEGAFWEYCSVVSEELERQRKFYERMEREEDERYARELAKVDRATEQIEKEMGEKVQLAKKLSKKNKKFEKRLGEVRAKCRDDRELLGEYERRVKEEDKEPSMSQIEEESPRIQQKLKILQDLQGEISNILMKLTE